MIIIKLSIKIEKKLIKIKGTLISVKLTSDVLLHMKIKLNKFATCYLCISSLKLLRNF